MSSFNMNLINKSQAPITVTGQRGDNFSDVALGQVIQPGGSLVVATFDGGGPFQDNWGWILLTCGTVPCQIYAEENTSGKKYTFFGYFDADSSESDSNPKPFPEGYATATGSFTYTLVQVPPPPSGQASPAADSSPVVAGVR